MISNKFYDNISQDLLNIIKELEEDLIDNVTLLIGDNTELFDEIFEDNNIVLMLDWQDEKLAKLTKLTETNIRTVKKTAKKQIREIENIIKMSGLTVAGSREGAYKNAVDAGELRRAVPIEDSVALQVIHASISTITKQDFNRLNNSMVASAGEMYVDMVISTTNDMLAGIKSPQQSMRELVNKWGAAGLTGFRDKIGRIWKPDTYANLLLRSNAKESAKQSVFARNEEYGNDYIELSSHNDARELCAEDQGQIFSMSGNTQPIVDLNGEKIIPRDWNGSTTGEPAGILGINCTHQAYPFIPSFSQKTYDKLNEKEVSSNYDERQQQRYIERNIRQYKTTAGMHKNTGNVDAAKIANENTRNWQARARAFERATGRKRQAWREQI